jgi:hypothetical protein
MFAMTAINTYKTVTKFDIGTQKLKLITTAHTNAKTVTGKNVFLRLRNSRKYLEPIISSLELPVMESSPAAVCVVNLEQVECIVSHSG